MTSGEMASAIGTIATTDDPGALSALAAALRRRHPRDTEAETVARSADRKRLRLVQEN